MVIVNIQLYKNFLISFVYQEVFESQIIKKKQIKEYEKK